MEATKRLYEDSSRRHQVKQEMILKTARQQMAEVKQKPEISGKIKGMKPIHERYEDYLYQRDIKIEKKRQEELER